MVLPKSVQFGIMFFIALRCYTCSVSESDNDQRCITDPASVETGSAITDCDKAYCTSIRIEYLVSINNWSP